jgi:GNAT superfamily N-acetyltransferase
VANKKKDFKGDPSGLIGDAMWSVVKPLYREAKKRERDAARAARASASRIYHAPEPKVSQKDIVFEILPQAITNAGADFNARDLYYASRTLAYAHDEWESGKELNYGYFSQMLLTEYQEQNGPIEGLWRDPRGNLHEPHTGKLVALGTREVAAYAFPDYVFDKILYVEKEGELSKLKAARLAERYDMAICSGKGQPTEAVRTLFERAEGGDYQLFVFHDADLDGYDIARVMAEETRRMPGYSVDVIDIGLTVEDALEMGLDSEPFYRKKDITWELLMRLSEVARECLYQKDGYRGIRGERFELNAILPDTCRIEYIERKLEENGVRGKVIPPEDALAERRAAMYREKTRSWVEDIIAEMLDTDKLKKQMAEEFQDRFKLQGARAWIETGFKRDHTLSWRDALKGTLQAIYDAKHKTDLEEAVREYIRETVASGAEDAVEDE